MLRLCLLVACFAIICDASWKVRHGLATDHAWNAYKARWGKTYESAEAEYDAHVNHLVNRMKIHVHNSGQSSFRMGENEFMDLKTMNERKGYKKATPVPDDHHSWEKGALFTPPLTHGSLPESVDWRKHGLVTPVKDQGDCCSCWAFSATGALEGQTARATGKLLSLSEQNLLDCIVGTCDEGGEMFWAFDYVRRMRGLDSEAGYPYGARAGECRFRSANASAQAAGFARIESGNETALAWAVATVGPVAVAIDANSTTFQLYTDGIYYNPKCHKAADELDHGVLVVGYGKNSDGHEYWLVKNSWGEGWGDGGYIKMARNQDNMCGIATDASYPLI